MLSFACVNRRSWPEPEIPMPIPPLDKITGTLPPHLGDPRQPSDLSPYPCTILELVQRFSYSPERKSILEGLLEFRKLLSSIGLQGQQWIDGSFLEDVEGMRSRPPGDIDVVSFVWAPVDLLQLQFAIAQAAPQILSPAWVKASYKVDHFLVSLGSNPWLVVNSATYYYGLFSHTRDSIWKGMVVVPFGNSADEDAALNELRNLP